VRKGLTELINRFDLYPDLRRRYPLDVALDQMRHDMEIELTGPEQVSGRKTFLLVPPPQHRELYRYGSAESPINPFAPDLQRFPRFAEAAPQMATLRAGEAILIPKYWWHCVYAHEPSVNLATCFSWKGERSAWSVLAGAPLHHRALTVVAAELKRRGFVATADTTRRLWLAAYQRLVPRVTPQPRAPLEE